MAEVLTKFIIRHAEVQLESFVEAPSGPGPFPAVLLFPGATGPGESFRATARELASRGYLVFGIDMYGVEADLSTAEAAGGYFQELLGAPQVLRARVVAWFEAVRDHPGVDGSRVSAIGYCFGGKCVLELARSGADLRSVTSFHGLLKTHEPARPGGVKAHVAIWSGGRDPYAPIEDYEEVRREFDAAGAEYQATLFAWAAHSFTDPDHDGFAPGIEYDRLAHRISWSATVALLEHCSQ